MTLWDPDREEPEVAPRDAIQVVHAFLRNCHGWATDKEIPKRLARVADSADPEDAAKLHAWLAYRCFVEHTIRELEDGTLDHWFGVE